MIRQIAFIHSRVQFQYLINGTVVNTVRRGAGAAGGEPRGEGRRRGQQLVEDAAEGGTRTSRSGFVILE